MLTRVVNGGDLLLVEQHSLGGVQRHLVHQLRLCVHGGSGGMMVSDGECECERKYGWLAILRLAK